MPPVEWHQLFAITVSPLELIVRGSLMYWFLFLIFRVFVRRDAGSIAIADILLLVIIASAARNAMAGDYKSITDGCILVSVIVGWNILLDWLAYRSRTIERLLEPPKRLLIRNGRIQHRALRREFMTEEQLLSKLREHGVASTSEVKRAYLEASGSVTVIR